MIKVKRVYDKAAASDGSRLLIDRLWPRGLKQTDVALDGWLKESPPATVCASGSAINYAAFGTEVALQLSRDLGRSCRDKSGHDVFEVLGEPTCSA